jgi:ribonuclease G
MAKEICISSTPHETRLAILEDDQLSEIYYERENEYTLAGSIYNGKVTRVLPGMQSAFVDVGLERDAFLYVTDFMELDDTEETDELEKAAASGATTPPREVRSGGGRQQEERPEPRQEARPEPRQEPRQESRQEPKQEPKQEGRPEGRNRRDRGDRQQRAPRVEAAPALVITETELVLEPAQEPAEQSGFDSQDMSTPVGGRRWRGRRGRRGRGQQEAPEQQGGEEQVEAIALESPEEENTTDIHASAVAEPVVVREPRRQEAARPEPRAARDAAPAAFVLPGESLSKYGGTPVDEAPKAAAPVRPASTFKPSTMIQGPLEWDGSGLLPGESLSLRRDRKAEPAVEAVAEPVAEAAAVVGSEPGQVAEVEFIEEVEETKEVAPAATLLIEEELEEEILPAPASSGSETEPEEGSASHNVDPATPTGFRLFGFGKKKEEKSTGKDATGSVRQTSSYAPGVGRVEEEIIDDDEFVATPKQRRQKTSPASALVEYEEQTLASRKGGGKNALEEARRAQMGAEEDADEEEEEEGAEGTTAQPRRTDRTDRSTRGRRGRGQQAQQPGNRRGGPSRRSMQTSDLPVISELLKPGQEILVQIAKEPIAKKGARITSHIALPGRFLVFMPTVSHVGVSRKIESEEERHRLKKILVHERGEASGGFIVRTAAEGASEEELRADLRFLMNLWNDIKQRSDSQKSPALIYHDLSLIERILRDQVSTNFSNIWVDSEANYERIVRFLNRFSPALVRRVKLYTKETPMFEHFGIEDEISKALRSKVWLKSGGSIVINQTEALVAIDINTGKYVGKSARLEDTIVKTNMDAVPEIVRQIRLRDLGGIIVIDFIDMDERKNRFRVLAALEEALKNDRAPTKVLQFNDFGLVAITRKRVKQSLERTLSVPCPTCQATGMVKSPITVANEIYVELRKMKKHFEGPDVLLRVHPETVKILKGNNASWLSEFEELTGKNILVKSDPTLHPEQFDVQG